MIISNYIKILQSSPQGTLITYCEDGSKAKVIVWFYSENGKIYVISNKNSKKVKHLQKNPRACLKVSHNNRTYNFCGKTSIITKNDDKYRDIAYRIWVLHPTYYGPFENVFKTWTETDIIIELQIEKVYSK